MIIMSKLQNSFFFTRFLISLLAFVSCQHILSQGFRVKDFRQIINDGSAFNAPLDTEGHPCGLIKVRTDNADLQFKGDIIGNVENKMNEYWVYMSQSCSLLKIGHPNFMPLVVPFSEYSISISPKATYILTLEEIKYKKEKTGVAITVKPDDADLHIDDTHIENLSGNGYYQLYLPKGDHVCRLSKLGYKPYAQIVQSGKVSQSLNVELESVMAELEVKCKTQTSEIYIDGEFKGNGVWNGVILPEVHQIEVRQVNYEPYRQKVTLEEKETRIIVIPELKRSTSMLAISTEPSEMPIVVDGNFVGYSPLQLKIESGIHKIECNKDGGYGCKSYNELVELESCKEKGLKIVLVKDSSKIYRDAYNGDINALMTLAVNSPASCSYREKVFWAKRVPHLDNILNQISINVPFDIENVGNGNYIHEKELKLALLIDTDKAYEAVVRAEKNGSFSYPDKNSSYWSSLGAAYKNKGLYDKAIQCYIIACERDKDRGELWESLGDLYKERNNNLEAANCYKKSMNLLKDFQSDYKRRLEKKYNDSVR